MKKEFIRKLIVIAMAWCITAIYIYTNNISKPIRSNYIFLVILSGPFLILIILTIIYFNKKQ